MLQRVRAAGGDSDSYNAAWRQRRTRGLLLLRLYFDGHFGANLPAGSALGDFYFVDELDGDGVEMTGRGVSRLGDKVDGAEGQGFECGVRAFLRMRAENNHRHRRAAHDQTQRLKPIQSRHFEVKRDYVRVQLFDFLQRECAVHCRADDLDGWIAFEDRGNKFPHERGIIDNEHSDSLAHAMAPRGEARERRERTAGTCRMSTTVPTPRLHAVECQRDGQVKRGAASLDRGNGNRAFQMIENRTDHVHPHAAPRYFRDFRRGAEARLKNEVQRFGIGETLNIPGFNNSLFDRQLADFCEVHAAAVIAYFDHHLRALVIRVQIHRATGRFSRGDALLSILYPVA